jgi:DNA-binding MltR family transcriptional regulator
MQHGQDRGRTLSQDEVKGWLAFFDEFNSESDRAAAILGAAYLDELLGQLLTNFLIVDKASIEELISPSKPYAPLSAFAARITMAYCLGFISTSARDDLRIIKNIRNSFAHQLHGISFTTTEVERLCNRLRTGRSIIAEKAPALDSSRYRYIVAVSLLAQSIGSAILRARQERRSRLEIDETLDDSNKVV